MEIRTPRLQLKPIDPKRDSPALHRAWADPEATRYWHRPPSPGLQQTTRLLELMASAPDDRHWAIYPSGGGDGAIGHVSLLGLQSRQGSMEYFITRGEWSRGYASEAARAVLECGFTSLGLFSLELLIFEGNERSERVAQSIGCRLQARLERADYCMRVMRQVCVYGVTAEHAGFSFDGPPPVWILGLQPRIETANVDQSVEFYRNRLGFEVAWLAGSPAQAAIVTRRGPAPHEASLLFVRTERIPSERSGVLAFMVSDVDRLAAEFRDRGLRLEDEPAEQSWGSREFGLRDCHGQRLRFVGPR